MEISFNKIKNSIIVSDSGGNSHHLSNSITQSTMSGQNSLINNNNYNNVNSNRDRLLIAKKSRQLQLERWEHFEKENPKSTQNGRKNSQKSVLRNIQFGKDVILLEAISRNDISEVTELLKQGVDPNSITIDGLTGLHQCCIDDYLDMGNLLLEYNANVNAVDSEMWTPLHAAATCGNADMCDLLIRNGADFLAINSDGNMPYDICEGSDTLTVIETEMSKRNITQEEIDQARLVPEQLVMNSVKDLIRSRDNLDRFDDQGATILHVACSLGYNEVVKTLLEAGANHSLPDKEGWKPVHIAACWNYLDIVENLVVYGANIDDTNSNNDTVFDICEPQFKDRLLHIKNNIETIRRNFDFNRLPQSKSFRKSRGSSIRRTSVRHKNMMSRKEAKEEFLTLNQPVATPTEDKVEDSNNNIINDNDSDIDAQTVVEHPKDDHIIPKKEVNASVISETVPVKKPNGLPDKAKADAFESSCHSNNSSRDPLSKPKKSNRAPQPPQPSSSQSSSTVDPDNNSLQHSQQQITPPTDVQLKSGKPQQPNDDLDALNRPRYRFSDSDNITDVSKKSRNGKCCALL